MNLYLNTHPYLAQWAVNFFGGSSPIVLPKRSPERDVLAFFLKKRPEDLRGDIDPKANLIIQIPYFRDKPAERGYTYLPPKACKLLIRRLKTRLRIQLWEDMHTLDNYQREISSIVWAWMEANGIELTATNWETIRQMYFRMRKATKINENK